MQSFFVGNHQPLVASGIVAIPHIAKPPAHHNLRIRPSPQNDQNYCRHVILLCQSFSKLNVSPALICNDFK